MNWEPLKGEYRPRMHVAGAQPELVEENGDEERQKQMSLWAEVIAADSSEKLAE